MSSSYDVVVLGEPLVERHRDPAGSPVGADSVSGDALNAACAAARAGAKVALLTVLGRDRAGDEVVAHLRGAGVGVEHVLRADAPTGAYTVLHAADGDHSFAYERAGSAASTMAPELLGRWGDVLDGAGLLVTGGIAGAISPGAAALVQAGAERVAGRGGAVCFDVNLRPALTTADAARALLAAVAPHCSLVKIASPADSAPLLGEVEPDRVADAVLQLGAATVLVTSGGEAPVLLAERDRRSAHPVAREPLAVDTTGAGDVLLGSLAAARALGASWRDGLPAAMRAAAASTRSRGGSPHVTLTPTADPSPEAPCCSPT